MTTLPPDDWYEDENSPEWDMGDSEPRDPLQGLLDELGIESFESIILDFSQLPDDYEARALEFATFEEALYFLNDIGVLGFSGVYETEDGYGIAIRDTSE